LTAVLGPHERLGDATGAAVGAIVGATLGVEVCMEVGVAVGALVLGALGGLPQIQQLSSG